MAELRASGLDLIREYIPESPEFDSEDEADLPDYQPSAICEVPELEEEEEVIHEKFADSPASPPPTGDVPMDTTPGNQFIQPRRSEERVLPDCGVWCTSL